MHHCGSGSKRIIHVQSRKKCKTGWNKQQSHVKNSMQMQTGEQNKPQKTKTMALKLPNGQKAKTDKENMSVYHPHCIRIFKTTEMCHQKP
jgi:hypothetical protein